jgi:hypothetical protein
MEQIHFNLHQEILGVFNDNGIQIMSLHYINDQSGPVVVSKDEWCFSPAKIPEA